MKKLVQICSILSLVFVFSAISAQAQTVTRYEAQIPFDFNIGEKSYPAGSYVIRIAKNTTSSLALYLEDNKGKHLETAMVVQTGQVSKNEPEFVFSRYENQRFLTTIRTPERGFSFFKSDTEKQLTKKNREARTKTQIAAVPNK
jgi:hypothetical protein